MNKFLNLKHCAALLLMAVALLACNKKNDEQPLGAYQNGTIVLNEGVFMQNNASLSFIANNFDSVGLDIFKTVNKKQLGDVLQSAAQSENDLYLVVNLSNKIEVVERGTMKNFATINGLNNPRFMKVANSSKAYVTNWGNPFSTPALAPYLAVIDLKTKNITKKLYTGAGAEHLQIIQNRLYVGAAFTDKIYVYDINTDALLDSISTAPHSPYSMIVDENEKLWVMTYSFDANYNSSLGAIMRFDVKNNKRELSLPLDASPNNIKSNLLYDKQLKNFYYMTGAGIFQFQNSATSLPKTPFIAGNYSAIGMNNAGQLFLGIANFSDVSKNFVKVFDKSGKEIKSFQTGFAPNSFVF